VDVDLELELKVVRLLVVRWSEYLDIQFSSPDTVLKLGSGFCPEFLVWKELFDLVLFFPKPHSLNLILYERVLFGCVSRE
jgi:hypothetical protein